MKSFSLLFVSSLTLSGSASNACPGGHLRLLVAGNMEVGVIDLVKSTLTVSSEFEIEYVQSITEGDQKAQVICGQDCPNSIQLHVKGSSLLQSPKSDIFIDVKRNNQRLSFQVTDFYQTRGMGCAKEITPRGWKD